jgi:uncharacterized membrane protein (TIGR02234 family)
VTTPDTAVSAPLTPLVLTRQRRLRLYTILGIGVLALLTLLTTTQDWWTLHLAGHTVDVQGTVAAGALSALALCGIALAAALAIAGPVFRLILGLIQLLIAFTIVFTSSISLADPEQPSAQLLTTATGIEGDTALHKLILSVTYTPWGSIAIAVGILAFLAGIWLLLTFRLWPVASRKYSSARFEEAGDQASRGPRDAVVDWDALSSGEDPTDDSKPVK